MSFLGNLIGKNKKLKNPYDLGLKVDFHSHLIPGIDDGCQNLHESLTLVKAFKSMGYEKLITTPHIMSDFYKNSRENIMDGLEQLRQHLKDNDVDMPIEAAAEYYVDGNFMQKIGKEELLTFGDNYILIETNTINYSDIIRTAIWELNVAGYKVVYAHPERYTYYWKNFNALVNLKEMGVYFQINLPSLGGLYSDKVKNTVDLLIKEDMVDFIGSDAHEMRYIKAMKDALYYPGIAKIAPSRLMNNSLK